MLHHREPKLAACVISIIVDAPAVDYVCSQVDWNFVMKIILKW